MKTKNILLLSMAIMAPAWAGVLPNDAVVDGRTIGEWTSSYLQWIYLQPTNQSPAFDTDGSRANNGQSGPVFFVTGGFYSGPQATRSYTVPEGKYLLIPLIIIEVDNIDTIPPMRAEELRDLAVTIIDTTSELHFSLDGVALTNLFDHREPSPVFGFTIPSADNLFTFFYGHSIVGINDPAVADGYWLMLEPLAPGPHRIIFGGTYGAPNSFSYERSDVITVVPVPLSQRVEELISTVAASNLPGKRTRPLLATLRGAEKSFERDHLRAGIAHLRAFQKKVRHEITRIDPALAEQLIAAAQQIIDRANQNLKKVHNHDGAQP